MVFVLAHKLEIVLGKNLAEALVVHLDSCLVAVLVDLTAVHWDWSVSQWDVLKVGNSGVCLVAQLGDLKVHHSDERLESKSVEQLVATRVRCSDGNLVFYLVGPTDKK